ncbi:hypothetical protein CL634_02825 [bacterium]|nr:hypothetical protein [bacterium]
MSLEQHNRRANDKDHEAMMKALTDNTKVLSEVRDRVLEVEIHAGITAKELKKGNGRMEKLEIRSGKLETGLAVVKVKSGVFGTIGGAIGGFFTTLVKGFNPS